MRKFLTVLFFITICTIAVAATVLPIRKFGGLNTRTNIFEIQDSESPDMSNFTLDEAGTLTERSLFKYYNTSSVGNTAISNVYKFYKSSDAGYMVCSGGTNLYKASSGVLTDISVSADSVISGSHWAFETFTDGTNELVFAANNNIPLKSWNGTDSNFTEKINYPATNCNLLKKHKARLWAAGSKTYPYRIYYSSLNDGDDWNTSGGSFDLPSYEKIMALEVLSDTLFVFTRTSVYAILGDTPNEFALQKTRSTVGTHATKSVVVGNRLIIFLNKSGVFAFDGDEAVNISESIQPTIDAISNTYISDAAGLYDSRGRYWLSYTSTNGSFNDKILVYDTVIKQWYMLDGVNISSFFRADGGTDKGEIFAGTSNPVGYLWQLQTSSGLEQIVHSSQTQLSTGVTSNTVVTSTPTVELLNSLTDDFTKLLIHFDGTDGSTDDYIAETGQTIELEGSAAEASLDSDAKFGTTSIELAGGDCKIASSTDWNLGTGDFTIDLWVQPDATNTEYPIVYSKSDASNYWKLVYSESGNGGIRFLAQVGGSNTMDFSTTSSAGLTVGIWAHIAIVRSGTTPYIFVNGVSQTVTITTALGNASQYGTTYLANADGTYFRGRLDEVRLSKGIARWKSNFEVPEIPYNRVTATNGSLTSDNLQINASGQASLGAISWQETLPTNTDIQFTTRTGVTDDTVEYNGWQTWVSTSTVVNPVTDHTAWSTNGTMVVSAPTVSQPRDILYYETDNNVSPNTIQFTVLGGKSRNAYATNYIPIKDLSNYKFVGYWLKSAVSGNVVELALSNTTGNTVGYTTANTVSLNTWEYHYWPLTGYADLKDINKVKLTYKGTGSGNIYLGDIYAYDFLDTGETITSTPNDFIQYKAILGTNALSSTPKLIKANEYVVTISYSSTSGTSESSLTSYWKSKRFDFGQPNLTKYFNWVELTTESQNPTTGNTCYLDYTLDDGRVSGTLSQTFSVTGQTTKLRYYFPSGSYGKNMDFTIRSIDVDDDVTVKNAVISFRTGGNL